MTRPTTADLLTLPGAGDASGTHLVTKIHASKLNDDYSVMEGVMKPRSLLAPHTHEHEDQVVVVLSGELVFQVGGEDGERFTAPAGSYVLKPRGHEHTFWNATEQDARYIELSGKAGFQGFVDESTEHGSFKASRRSDEQFGIVWSYHRIPKLMIENKLTSISGLDMPWDELAGKSPAELIAIVRDKLRAAG
ncbi:cupin domain-containing protein [Paraliomyxa miuraensis]|uniref:cupin domain-containing protein n=1 Tax=Paraliomyxa miuraensis TaxID=376150 RepID=UPI002252DA0A|nr:cupin domain-containing protein [Paraliomyxa miuraensis]MCX4241825.1 cupin domain-containing protein [Paraliomyxa miuraensis]